MALDKAKVDIPLGGGLQEHVDKRLFNPPFVRKANNVDVSKGGAYQKRRGYEALPGASLPTDDSGINTPFDYRGGVHLVSQRGVYMFDEGDQTWTRSRSVDMPTLELENEHEIHGARSLRRFDHVSDGTNRIEVWEEVVDASTSRIWFQLRDVASGTITVPARVIDSSVTHSPRVVYQKGLFWVLALDGDPTSVGVPLREISVNPTSGAVGTPNQILSSVRAFDVDIHPSDNATYFIAFKGGASNLLYRWEPLVGLSAGSPLTDAVIGGAVGLFVDTVSSSVFVTSTGLSVANTDLYVERFDFVPASVWAKAAFDGIANFPDYPRSTCAVTRDGTSLLACVSASAEVDLDYDPGAVDRTKTTSDKGRVGRMRWRMYAVSNGDFTSDPSDTESAALIGHAFVPKNSEPVVPIEHHLQMGGTDSQFWANEPQPVQTFSYLATLDTDTFSIDPQTGLETSTLGAFPILSARFNDGASTGLQDQQHSHMSRAYLDATANDWRFVSPILRELRAIGRSFGYKFVAGGRVYRMNFEPGPLRVITANDTAYINTGMLTSFDGQVQGESSPLCNPVWVAARYTQAPGALGFFFNGAGNDAIVQFGVDLEVVDRAGNVKRTGPAIAFNSEGGNSFTFEFDISFLAAQQLDFELWFTLPDLTQYLGQAGLGWRAKVYFGAMGTEMVEVGVFPVDIVNFQGKTGTGQFLNIGYVQLTETERIGTADGFKTIGPPPGAAPWPWSVELLPERPPPFRDIAAVGARIYGISAENPSELWLSKSLRFGRNVEWAPSNNSVATSAEFTTLATMDDKVLLFTPEEVFVAPATVAPTDAGGGLPPVPQLVATDVGCTNKRSIVSGPFGVMFRGKRGIYQMDRGLTLRYIGGPVEDTLAAQPPIATAVMVPEDHEVRFTTDGGQVMLVYDYAAGVWSTREMECVGAAVVQERYVVSNNTGLGYAVTAERLAADSEYQDVGIADNVMSFETAWIKMAGSVAGYKRIKKVIVTGEYHDLEGTSSPGNLVFDLFYDYEEDSPFETKSPPLGGTGLSDGDPFQIELRPAKQKCEAMKIRVTEVPGTDPIGNRYRRGVTVSMITLELAVKRGLYKRPQIRR